MSNRRKEPINAHINNEPTPPLALSPSLNGRPPLLVSRREAAYCLGICLKSVENLIADGTLPTVRIRRRRMVPYHALERLVRAKTR